MNRTNITRDNKKEYKSWFSMKSRCCNLNDKSYPRYGGRGIKVCDRWLESFANFLEDMGKCPEDKKSLNRIDNNGNYCLENCEWADAKEQANNNSGNKLLTFNNKTQNTTQWAKETGISRVTINARLRLGWSVDKVLTTPTRVVGNTLLYEGKSHTISEWAEITGISKSTIHRRLKEGWDTNDILSIKTLKKGKRL